MQWLRTKSAQPLLAACVMVWLTMWALSCAAKDDTLAIRVLIEKGAKLAEAHETGPLMNLAAEDFIASPGRHDSRKTKPILFLAFRHYGQLKIRYPRPSVDLNEQSDKAKAAVYFTILKDDQSLPGLPKLYDDPKKWIQKAGEMVDLYQLRLQVIKVKKKWLVESADWEGFKGFGF